ncbi:MAG: polysaccharide deacetylase family protein [Bacillota bacterium]|nr:polysaccharide deacetylase family protein [Bacillota bacterium]
MKKHIIKYIKLLSLLGLAFFVIFYLYNENFHTNNKKSFNLYIGNYKESKEPNSNTELKNQRDNKYKTKLLENLNESKDNFNQAQVEMNNKNFNKAIALFDKVVPIDKKNYPMAQKLLNTCKLKTSNNVLLSNTKVNIKNKVNYSNIKIPILMYHSITKENGNSLQLSKEDFYRQMKYIKENSYTPINLDDLFDFLSGKRKAPKKPIVFTFDDGYEDNYINAYPILKEFGFKATIFDITNTIDKNNAYIKSNQIKEMINNGISIESHTIDHNNLAGLSYKSQYEILKKAREDLEGIEGRKIKYLAYPSGKYNSFTEKAAKDAGYIMAVTTYPGFASESNGYLFLHRVRVSSGRSLEEFIKSIRE